MPRIRVPIWLLMGAILVFGVYIAAFRILMERRIGGEQTPAMKLGIAFGLVALTTSLLAIAGAFWRRK